MAYYSPVSDAKKHSCTPLSMCAHVMHPSAICTTETPRTELNAFLAHSCRALHGFSFHCSPTPPVAVPLWCGSTRLSLCSRRFYARPISHTHNFCPPI